MKRRLNLLCVLVVLVLGYSVFDSVYQMISLGVSTFETGYQAGKEEKDIRADLEKLQNVQHIALFPEGYPILIDSVLNEKAGEYVPAMYSQMIVSVKTEPSRWQKFTMKFMSFVYLFTVLFAIFVFVRLIISINKSDIFDWKNVRRLRWLGGSLILCFICELIPAYMTSAIVSEVFSLKGYSFNLSELFTITNLVLGISALIVGEVFAIGLRMKEEQDLTI